MNNIGFERGKLERDKDKGELDKDNWGWEFYILFINNNNHISKVYIKVIGIQNINSNKKKCKKKLGHVIGYQTPVTSYNG